MLELTYSCGDCVRSCNGSRRRKRGVGGVEACRGLNREGIATQVAAKIGS